MSHPSGTHPERVLGLIRTWNQCNKGTSAEVVESQQTLSTRENAPYPNTQVILQKLKKLTQVWGNISERHDWVRRRATVSCKKAETLTIKLFQKIMFVETLWSGCLSFAPEKCFPRLSGIWRTSRIISAWSLHGSWVVPGDASSLDIKFLVVSK